MAAMRNTLARSLQAFVIVGSATVAHPATYVPPEKSAALLSRIDFAAARPLDEDYRGQFVACDGEKSDAGKDVFRGHSLTLAGVSSDKQFYLCSRDPSRVEALLKLSDGAILWQSKMALDVDGAWAAWNGLPGATDLKFTSFQWPSVADKKSQAAQVDPDRYPFVVMPMAGLKKLTGADSDALGREYRDKTGLSLGDMGVVVYEDKWSPVLIADGGPFMRLGEGSSGLFEALGQSRCKQWNAERTACVGPGDNKYPYKNFGLSRNVIFILYPGSRSRDITPDNAVATLCAFAEANLHLTGSAFCPR